jgi:O-acetyl-ADP-ribose deacetylase (regulator of RNase III)
MRQQIGRCALELVLGDITRQDTDAIVNAANSSLMGGGGVDGAIHRAGGPRILEECKAIRAKQGKLPTGKAVITSGGDLAAKWVIHTVGPVWRGGEQGEPELLRSCYFECVELARERKLTSLAFPSVSTGVYGYPVDLAALEALGAVVDELKVNPGTLKLVRWVLFDKATMGAYVEALTNLDTVIVEAPAR